MTRGRKLTDEEKKIFAEKVKKTKLERYGDENYNNMDKMKATKQQRYGNPNYNNYDKYIETCLERYGTSHHNKTEENREKIKHKKLSKETQEKYESTMMERYGATCSNDSDEINQKRLKTLKEHYGVEHPLQSPIIKEKQVETMILKGTINKSKIEDKYKELLINTFGIDDIICQYTDIRYKSPKNYKYRCDFYIKSLDLFIEINNHPTHYTHPFNEKDESDTKLFNELINSEDRWSKRILEVWCIRDRLKYQCAVNNKLNYIMIYPKIRIEMISENLVNFWKTLNLFKDNQKPSIIWKNDEGSETIEKIK